VSRVQRHSSQFSNHIFSALSYTFPTGGKAALQKIHFSQHNYSPNISFVLSIAVKIARLLQIKVRIRHAKAGATGGIYPKTKSKVATDRKFALSIGSSKNANGIWKVKMNCKKSSA
jgi:hypothetical protein